MFLQIKSCITIELTYLFCGENIFLQIRPFSSIYLKFNTLNLFKVRDCMFSYPKNTHFVIYCRFYPFSLRQAICKTFLCLYKWSHYLYFCTDLHKTSLSALNIEISITFQNSKFQILTWWYHFMEVILPKTIQLMEGILLKTKPFMYAVSPKSIHLLGGFKVYLLLWEFESSLQESNFVTCLSQVSHKLVTC